MKFSLELFEQKICSAFVLQRVLLLKNGGVLAL